MLKFPKRRSRSRRRRHRRALQPYRAELSVVDTNPDLRIRDLRDDPRMRRALGLDERPSVNILDGAA